MKAQTLGNSQMSQFMTPKKTLELNPDHEMIKELDKLVKLGNGYNNLLNYYIDTMYNSALIDSGFSLENPRLFSENIYKMMGSSLLNINSNPDKFYDDSERKNLSHELENKADSNVDNSNIKEDDLKNKSRINNKVIKKILNKN